MICHRLAPLLLLLAMAAPARAADDRRLARTFERYAPSVVAIRYTLRLAESPEGGQGNKIEGTQCGVVAGPGGLVITTADIFPEPDGDPRQTFVPAEFRVRTAAGNETPFEAIGLDRKLNIAFLRPLAGAAFGAPAVRFSRRSPRPGEVVLLIGLLGETYGHAPTFLEARVAAGVERERATPMFALDRIVQDLTIGGLVVTPAGEPLGIVGEDPLPAGAGGQGELAQAGNVLSLFASLSQGRRPGYPMLFPHAGLLDTRLKDPPPLRDSDLARRGWLGIVMQPLSRDLADYWNIPGPGGVVLGAVLAGAPAESGGLRVGDVIVEVGGRPVEVREQKDLARFREQVQAAGAGRDLPVGIMRDGRRLNVVLTLGASPKTVFLADSREDREFGFTVREITYDFLQAGNLPEDLRGVFVSDVESAGWADVGGVETNDIVRRIDAAEITSIATFDAALADVRARRPAEVVLFVQRGSRTLFLLLRPEW